jgi:DnaJ-class molecular chaperone
MSEQTCPVCDGKGMVYNIQGGPHGVGRWGRCPTCRGAGTIEGGGDE